MEESELDAPDGYITSTRRNTINIVSHPLFEIDKSCLKYVTCESRNVVRILREDLGMMEKHPEAWEGISESFDTSYDWLETMHYLVHQPISIIHI